MDSVVKSNLVVLDNEKHCDIVFVVGEARERILSHRFPLMSRSPVFEVTFTKRWQSDREIEEIEIPDVEPSVFRQFLQYVYGDKLPSEIDETIELLYVADKYQVISLIGQCENRMAAEMELKNVITICQASRVCNLSTLKKQACDFMAKGISALLDEPSFQFIDEDSLLDLLSREGLLVSELKLFDALLRWSHFQLETGTPDSSEQRRVLMKILPLIRFPSMNIQEFQANVIPKGILTSDESTALLKYMDSEEPERTGLRTNLGFPWQPRPPQVSEYLLDLYEARPNHRKLLPNDFKKVTDQIDVIQFSLLWLAPSLSFGFNKTAFITSIILRGLNYSPISKIRYWSLMNKWKVSLKLEELPDYWADTQATSEKTIDNLEIFGDKDTVVDINPPFSIQKQSKYKISVSYTDIVFLPDALKLKGSETQDYMTSTRMKTFFSDYQLHLSVLPNSSRNDFSSSDSDSSFDFDDDPDKGLDDDPTSSHCIRSIELKVHNY